jgi:phosphoribosyl-ATP pyrophosphohydrolase
MTDAVKHPDLKIFKLQRRVSREDKASRKSTGRRHAGAAREPASVSALRDTGSPAVLDACAGIEMQSIQPSELDRLHRSLSEVTPENHPRTARLLASSTRKIAQKVIEEAGEVALEAVKHHDRGIVRESADLLYHLVALWHRAGINPDDVWTEMRCRADTLGIAEKLPKARRDNRRRPIRNVKPPAKTQQE